MPTNEEIERMDRIMDNATMSVQPGSGLESMIGSGTQVTWTTATLEDFRDLMNSMEGSPMSFMRDSYHYTITNNIITYDWEPLCTTAKRVYKNYTVQEVKHGKQTKFILTTKSGLKKEKLVTPNKIEQEKKNLLEGRVINYKQHWENV